MGPTRQIVITWDPVEYGGYGYFAATDVKRNQKIRILGAGFDPQDSITMIIIGTDDVVLGKKVTANDTGTFEAYRNIPKTVLYDQPTAVKAWLNSVISGDEVTRGELQATYPLRVLRTCESFSVP